MNKFLTCIFAATAAFMFTIEPTSVSYSATTIEMAPIVLNKDIMPTTTTTFYSLYLRFGVRPQAKVLVETVSTKGHDLYRKYQPVVLEAFDKVSAEFSVPDYSLFAYGRVDMKTVGDNNKKNHSIASTQELISLAAPRLNVTSNVTVNAISKNVMNLTQVVKHDIDGMVDFTPLFWDDSQNTSSVIISLGPLVVLDDENLTAIVPSARLVGSHNISAMDIIKKASITSFTSSSRLQQSQNMTSASTLHYSKKNMTPTTLPMMMGTINMTPPNGPLESEPLPHPTFAPLALATNLERSVPPSSNLLVQEDEEEKKSDFQQAIMGESSSSSSGESQNNNPATIKETLEDELLLTAKEIERRENQKLLDSYAMTMEEILEQVRINKLNKIRREKRERRNAFIVNTIFFSGLALWYYW